MFEIFDFILDLLGEMASSSLTLIGYALLPSYRKEKQEEWKGRPVKKYLILGFSGVCLSSLCALGIWISYLAVGSLFAAKPPPERIEKKEENGVAFEFKFKDGKTIKGKIPWKKAQPDTGKKPIDQ